MVIDWRAGLAHPFYRASPTRRYGVRARRAGYRGGTLTSIQDEVLELLDEAEALAAADRVLVAEIERPRIGPMRDIVATIQPEQDDLIRAPLAETICIQGGPGTGKTAVGLHRAAFLLYEHRDRLARDGVLVVGPGPAYLAFIRDVLPGLGEVDVAQLHRGPGRRGRGHRRRQPGGGRGQGRPSHGHGGAPGRVPARAAARPAP